MSITSTKNRTEIVQVTTGGTNLYGRWASNSASYKMVSEVRNRVSVPKFRELIRMQTDATGPYSCTWWNVTGRKACNAELTFVLLKGASALRVPGTSYVTASGPWAFSGLFPALPSICSSTLYSEARNKALKHLYRRDAEISHAFQGGVFAGELRKTIAMLKNPLKGLFDGLWGYLDDVQNKLARERGYLKRLSKKRRTKWMNDAVADSWLTATLGLLPLCNDIDGALKALGNLSDASESYGLTATGRAEGLVYRNNYPATVNQISAVVHERGIEKTSVRIKVAYKLTPPQVAGQMSMQQQLGLTLADFAPTIWNLLPGSFLYDYVTNIGDIIDAMAHPMTGYSYGVETVRTEVEYSIAAQLDYATTAKTLGTDFITVSGSCGSATAVAGRFQRNKLASSLIPSFEFSLDLSDRQLLNVAALLQKGNLVKLLSFGIIK